MSALDKQAVLLVAHGSVTDLEQLPAFLERIRRGRPPSQGLVRELRERYQRIGGSPLLAITREQARALGHRLGMRAYMGMRFSEPFVETALRQAIDDGVERLVVLPVAPYSVAVYTAVVREVAASLAARELRCPGLVEVEPWGQHPLLVRAHVDWIRQHAGELVDTAPLVLSAHSLPTAVIRSGDRYDEEVRASAQAVAQLLGRPALVAYQSQGADGGDWIGPSLTATLEALAESGECGVVLAPLGFLADHVETLFDLDVEARAYAESLGLSLLRVPALNAAAGLIEAAAAVVETALLKDGPGETDHTRRRA